MQSTRCDQTRNDVTKLEKVVFMDAKKMIGLKPGVNFIKT